MFRTPGNALAASRETVRELRGGGRGWILLVVAVGWFLALGVRVVIPALLPDVTAEFAISNTTAGVALTLLWVAYASMQFPAGVLVDRSGERRVLLASLLIAIAGTVLFATAPFFPAFLAACVLFGLGTGLYGPPRVTALANTYPERSGTAIGLTFASGNLGATVLPFAAGLVAAAVGWRAGFGFALPLFVLAALGAWWYLPDRSSDVAGAVTESAGHAARRIAAGITRPSVLLVGGATTLTIFTYQAFTAFYPTYLVATKGLSGSAAAAIFGLFFATRAAIQPLAGGVADRFGDRYVFIGLAGVHVVALVVLPFVGGPLALAALTVVLGTRGGITPSNHAYINAALPDDVQGSGYGLVRAVYIGIGATGSVVVGALADADLFDEAFLLLAAITAVAAGLYVLLPPRDRL